MIAMLRGRGHFTTGGLMVMSGGVALTRCRRWRRAATMPVCVLDCTPVGARSDAALGKRADVTARAGETQLIVRPSRSLVSEAGGTNSAWLSIGGCEAVGCMEACGGRRCPRRTPPPAAPLRSASGILKHGGAACSRPSRSCRRTCFRYSVWALAHSRCRLTKALVADGGSAAPMAVLSRLGRLAPSVM